MSHVVSIPVGRTTRTLPVRPDQLVSIQRTAHKKPTGDARELVEAALNRPFRFEPLRRALTPDDQVTIVLDESLPQLAELVAGVLEHLDTAGIKPEQVTLLTPPGSRGTWIDDLPDEFADVRTETHDPTDRTRQAYLAATAAGTRIYLNRMVVDADFTILLTGRGYDPIFGHGGGAASVFPALADTATRTPAVDRLKFDPPTETPWPARAEAEEVAWLMGTPFFVQVIPGAGDQIQDVIGGLLDSGAEAIRRHDRRWRGTVGEQPNLVVAAIAGDPTHATFADLAAAVGCATRVVSPGGTIVLLTDADPSAGEGVQMFAKSASPRDAVKRLMADPPPDWTTAAIWARAAETATIVLTGPLAARAGKLFAKPADDLQLLLAAPARVLLVPDAHRTLLELAEEKV